MIHPQIPLAIPVFFLIIDNEADRLFMQKLYTDNKRLMLSQVYRVLGDAQYAQDIISDTFLALINKIDKLKSMTESHKRNYLLTAARNTALTFADKQSRNRANTLADPEPALDTLAAEDAPVDAQILFHEQIEQVKRAILQLSPRERQLLEMKYFRELSNFEISESLDIKEESVRKAVMRARTRVYNIVLKEGRV